MTKYIIRRVLQAIPTIIGISILVYVIIDLVPGNPLSQVTQDPNLTFEDRQRIFEAYGFYDPIWVKYSRWLVGDAPYAFNEKPSWAVELSNGQTVIVDSASGDLLDRVDTATMRNDITDTPIRRNRAGEREINSREAESIVERTLAEDVTIVETLWLPYYDSVVIWQGRTIPAYSRGQLIGEEPGTDRGVIRGDFGTSFASQRSTIETIGLRIGATLELGVISLTIGLIFGIVIGVLAAVWRGSPFDQVTRVGAVIVSAVPVFWLGLILLLIFGSWLQWLPMGNRFPLSFTNDYTIGERIQHLILPVFTLSSFSIATFSRFMRASTLDVLNEDYVRTAESKGIRDRTIWFKHVLRNALIPIATLLGPSIATLLSGAVLTETIYSWPGMGRLLVDSVVANDYPVLMALVLLFSVLTIMGYLLSDILYAVFDPRIRFS